MDNSKLGKLVPKSIKARRERKRQSSIAETASRYSTDDSGAGHGEGGDNDTLPRGRSINREETHQTTTTDISQVTSNNSSMANSEATSLISYDSDPDPSDRPTFSSTYPSQIGYLTTNSPIVQAAHQPETLPYQATTAGSSADPSPRTSVTFPISTTSSDSVDPDLRLSTSKTGLVPPSKNVGRTPSPVGRLKDVFSRPKKSSSGSPSPERTPQETGHRRVQSNASQPDQGPAKAPEPRQTVAERLRRISQQQKIDTSQRPQTPPSTDRAGPTIVNTPPTPTEPTRPTTQTSPVRKQVASSPTTDASSLKGNMISQRRGRANSASIGPSKLSNSVQAPVTPIPENPATPGNAASGFFSSMFSAVQTTANTLSNTITNANVGQGGSRPRLPLSDGEQPDRQSRGEDNVEVESGAGASSENMNSSQEPAVKTLGKGDLSLSHLGIAEPSSNSTTNTPMTARFPDVQSQDSSRGRSESAPVDTNAAYIEGLDASLQSVNRPQSLYEPVGLGTKTPPQGSVYEGKSGSIHRSGSVRSAFRTRKRGSSAATGQTSGTIAAIIAASSSLAHPANPHAAQSTPKLTGFAVASKKRNRDFHDLFKSVPDDDYLIEDYSCAIQREILAHGRLYVSEGHLCFSSNIFGWVTTLVMSFDEIVSVEKRSTALLFKNGLEISTLHAKHIFASFTSRDSTYDLIVKIWKLGHPSLKSSLNGVRIDEMGGDKTERVETASVIGSATISGSGSDSESDEDGDDVYDEDDDDDEGGGAGQGTEQATTLDASADKAATRKPSKGGLGNGPVEKSDESGGAASNPAADFPGPATHAPTDCGDAGTHYDIVIGDEVIPAPLGKVYNLMFGPASAAWMGKWLTGDQKCTELHMDDKQGLTEANKTRSYDYIKPLNSSIGPRQTKCITVETLDNLDLEKAVNVSITTQNPDVPSGNVFSVKTKYCLSWAENNSTRVQANCTIEWTGKSWIKGPIEKGAKDGQTQYCKDLFASLKSAVATTRTRSNTINGGGASKPRRKGRKGKSANTSSPTSDSESTKKAAPKPDWGLLDPIRPIFGPVVDILMPVFTGNIVYGLLVGLLVATWFGFGSNNRSGRYGNELGYHNYPERVAAYEEMWRREESELWDWLEERVGLERLNGEPNFVTSASKKKQLAPDPRVIQEKMREDRMSEREILEAIKVTEEKLRLLKDVVGKDEDGKKEEAVKLP